MRAQMRSVLEDLANGGRVPPVCAFVGCAFRGCAVEYAFADALRDANFAYAAPARAATWAPGSRSVHRTRQTSALCARRRGRIRELSPAARVGVRCVLAEARAHSRIDELSPAARVGAHARESGVQVHHWPDGECVPLHRHVGLPAPARRAHGRLARGRPPRARVRRVRAAAIGDVNGAYRSGSRIERMRNRMGRPQI